MSSADLHIRNKLKSFKKAFAHRPLSNISNPSAKPVNPIPNDPNLTQSLNWLKPTYPN